jgi:hypothetical protein
MTMIIDTASRILLAGAFAMLLAGFVTGVMMSRVRTDHPETPKYLRYAHLSGYMQAPILFGLVIAVAASDWSPWLDTLGAALVVAGAGLLTAKDLANHALGVTDEFVDKGIGYAIGAVMFPLHVAGVVILGIGALG